MNVLMSAALIAGLQVATAASGQPALTDRDVTFSGTTVHLRCGGTRRAGAPLVVLEAGAGGGINSWASVPSSIAAFARVCAYDRPGTGASASAQYPTFLKAIDHASFVRGVMQAANEPPPYVMVGHSFGGIIVSLYAMAYPADVKGIVLVDSSHEDQQRRMEPITGPPPPKRIPLTPPPGVPPPPPPGLRMEDFSEELRKTPFRGDIPLVVLTGTRPPLSNDPIEIALQPVFLELHRDLASRSPRSAHVLLPNSGHLVPRDDPKAVTDAVRRVLNWR
jgi:pimeloyl-ACP methyl ester carboxylesterase